MASKIRPLLDDFTAVLKDELGLEVLLDPQPVGIAEPHARLTFTGGSAEASYCELVFQISVVGAGDGPGYFLEAVMLSSIALQRLAAKRNPGVHLFMCGQFECRYSVDSITNSAGQFTQNDREENEQTQFAYTYVEPRMITLRFPRALITQ